MSNSHSADEGHSLQWSFPTLSVTVEGKYCWSLLRGVGFVLHHYKVPVDHWPSGNGPPRRPQAHPERGNEENAS
jgi:hypothetical protein